jgi:hypothetical protein
MYLVKEREYGCKPGNFATRGRSPAILGQGKVPRSVIAQWLHDTHPILIEAGKSGWEATSGGEYLSMSYLSYLISSNFTKIVKW